MNPDDRRELELLLERQREAWQLLSALDQRIERLRLTLEKPQPPVSSAAVATQLAEKRETATASLATPPPLPVMPAKSAVGIAPNASLPADTLEPPAASSAPVVPSTPPDSSRTKFTPPAEPEPLELRVGSYWLARVGIVILLTGLVFLGNYAYHNWIAQLGAGGKLAMLYSVGGALAGVGAWLARKGGQMRGYARVLMAGGAAAIYYTTYAAHFVERLRVIDSPLVGGSLLLALAGGIVWSADRHRSQTVALLAVLLAYYTSAINPVGPFTLFSSLLLTGAAVFLLLRHRWVALSFASLAGAYGSYAFWRFYHVVNADVPRASESVFGLGVAFLCGYWLLFTAAVFLGRGDVFPGSRRTPFLTLNNGAFFALAGHHFASHRPGDFWLFATLLGAAMLALAALANRLRREDQTMDRAYLAQGLALVTIGLAAKLAGYQLAFTLAVESAVLLTCARWRHGLLYEMAALLAAAGAFGLAVREIVHAPAAALPLGGPLVAVLIFDAWWVRWQRREPGEFSWRPAVFTALGLMLAVAVISEELAPKWMPAGFALAALVCAGSIYLLRVPEVALLGQIFIGLAAVCVLPWRDSSPVHTAGTLLPLLASLALERWWHLQKELALSAAARRGLQFAAAGGALIIGFVWMQRVLSGDAWLVGTATAALATLLCGIAVRSLPVGFLGQLFTVAAAAGFADALWHGRPAWWAALAPVANLAATSLLLRQLTSRRASVAAAFPLREIARLYRIGASVLLAGWAFEYVSSEWRAPFFAAEGAAFLLIGAASRDRERAMIGAAASTVALLVFWSRFAADATWIELLAIAAIPASLRIARRFAEPASFLPHRVQTCLVAGALATAWLWVSGWVTAHAHGNLTVGWSLLALIVLAAGFALRERVYRFGGLAILALSVGRVFAVDVWRLETVYRILSFLILGSVLLLLGFAYNRFADQLRKWL